MSDQMPTTPKKHSLEPPSTPDRTSQARTPLNYPNCGFTPTASFSPRLLPSVFESPTAAASPFTVRSEIPLPPLVPSNGPWTQQDIYNQCLGYIWCSKALCDYLFELGVGPSILDDLNRFEEHAQAQFFARARAMGMDEKTYQEPWMSAFRDVMAGMKEWNDEQKEKSKGQ